MKRDLVYYGNPILRKKCNELKNIKAETYQIAQDLIETVLDKDGAGLAAPQIGYCVRMFVSRYENGSDNEGHPIICPPKVYINPKLTFPSSNESAQIEGCLSIPGIYEQVIRPMSIQVEALDIEGTLFNEVATGWRARNLMHENDHLNGVLFIDRIKKHRRKKIELSLKEIKKNPLALPKRRG